MSKNKEKYFIDGLEKCFDGSLCKWNAKYCALASNLRAFKHEQVKMIKPNDFNNDIRKFYSNFISKLESTVNQCKQRKLNKGDRYYMPNALTGALKDLIRGVNNSIKVYSESSESTDNIRIEFKENFPKKRVDLTLERPDGHRIFAEIKTNLTNNAFGAALFESMVIEKTQNDKFVIISIGAGHDQDEYLRNMSKFRLIDKPPFKEYINDVIIIFPYEVKVESLVSLLRWAKMES